MNITTSNKAKTSSFIFCSCLLNQSSVFRQSLATQDHDSSKVRKRQQISKSIGRLPQDNLTVLCRYNISEYNNNKKADNNNGRSNDAMIATHGYVILDELYLVYTVPPQLGYKYEFSARNQ
jgi:hypothetical protein